MSAVHSVRTAPARHTGIAALRTPRNLTAVLVILAGAVLPVLTTEAFISVAMTRILILGLVAASVIFLSTMIGWVSLAQWLIAGVAGFTFGNVVTTTGKGLTLGQPWYVGVVAALLVATAVAALLGLLSRRTVGIYLLMLTLTYAVIGFYFFAQVTTFSGSGGVTGIDPPAFLDGVLPLYYAALVLSVLVYLGFRLIRRTPFGLAMQGTRDDPVRMAALGFNVGLLRVAAFALAGFVAAIGGVMYTWWNGQIDPNTVGLGPTFDLLIIALIGGLAYLEGAWLGAFLFVVANLYLRDIPLIGDLSGPVFDRILAEDRFNTVVGIVLLVLMVASPGGLAGLAERGWHRLRGRGRRTSDERVGTRPPGDDGFDARRPGGDPPGHDPTNAGGAGLSSSAAGSAAGTQKGTPQQ